MGERSTLDGVILEDVPLDLVLTTLFAVATAVVVGLGPVVPSAVRIAVAVPLVLFFAGYALVSLVFPGDERTSGDVGPASLVERLVLSFGLSVVAVPLVALLVEYSPLPLAPDVVLTAVALATAVLAVAAAANRFRLPAEHRFVASVPSSVDVLGPGRLLTDTRRLVTDTRHLVTDARPVATNGRGRSRSDVALNVLLVASLVFSVVAVGVAITQNPGPDPYTTFTVMTRDDGGNLTASGYPTELDLREEYQVSLVLQNREGAPVDYTIVVELQRLRNATGPSPEVVEARELDRLRVSVPGNETRAERYAFSPTITGQGLRLHYLLYKGDPPADPSGENAYRSVSLGVNVSSTSSTVEAPRRRSANDVSASSGAGSSDRYGTTPPYPYSPYPWTP